jgi:hypothetical protein
MQSKRARKQAGRGKRRCSLIIDEAEAASASRATERKRAKGPTMRATTVIAVDEPDSGDEGLGAAVGLRTQGGEAKLVVTGDLGRGFFMDYDAEGNLKDAHYSFFVDPRRVVKIQNWEKRYNQRDLDPFHVSTIRNAMESERYWFKQVLLLLPIRAEPEEGQQAEVITPAEYEAGKEGSYWWYAVAGQHNAEAARQLLHMHADAAETHGLKAWPARPVYFEDSNFSAYAELSTAHNVKDTQTIERAQSSVIPSIRRLWIAMDKPEALMGDTKNNPEKIKIQAKYREFQKGCLQRTPYAKHWQASALGWTKDWTEWLRPWMTICTASDEVYDLVLKFYKAYEAGQLPGSDGTVPRRKKGTKGKVTKPGKARGPEGHSLVHYVPGTGGPGFFQEIHEPNMFCWKELADLNNREKVRALHSILKGDTVFQVQVSKQGKKAGKKGVRELVMSIKTDRAMLRMFHYIWFLHGEKKDDSEWKEPFFLDMEDLLEKFKDQGLTMEQWALARQWFPPKYVGEFCSRLGGPGEKDWGGLKRTADLYVQCPQEFRQFVRRVLKREPAQAMTAVRLSGNAMHIRWKETGTSTALVPFAVEPTEISLHSKQILSACKRRMQCHLGVLDLCDPVHLSDWTASVFTGVATFMKELCGTYWNMIVIVPFSYEQSFIEMLRLWPQHKFVTGRWRTRAQKNKTVSLSNYPLQEEDRIFVVMVYDGPTARFNGVKVMEPAPVEETTGTSRRGGGRKTEEMELGVPQTMRPKVAQMDRVDGVFPYTLWKDAGYQIPGAVYGPEERRPDGLWQYAEFLSREDEAVVILGKTQVGSVWDLMQHRRSIIAVEGRDDMIEFMKKYIDAKERDPKNQIEFFTPPRQYVADRDMFFKLGKKREEVWGYLFGFGPISTNDPDYRARVEYVVEALRGYHGVETDAAVRECISRFEHMYFLEGAEGADLNHYSIQIPEEKGFNMEESDEESDREMFGFEDPPPQRPPYYSVSQSSAVRHVAGLRGMVGTQLSAGASTQHPTPISLASPSTPTTGASGLPLDDATLSVGELMRKYGRTRGVEMAQLRSRLAKKTKTRGTLKKVGERVPPDVAQTSTREPVFLEQQATTSSKEDWGHDIVWHPDVFQPAVHGGVWVMCWKKEGKWVSIPKMSETEWNDQTFNELVVKMETSNPGVDPDYLVACADDYFQHMAEEKLLEFDASFYDLPTSPSLGKIEWTLPKPPSGDDSDSDESKGDDDKDGGGGMGGGGVAEERGEGQGGGGPKPSEREEGVMEGGKGSITEGGHVEDTGRRTTAAIASPKGVRRVEAEGEGTTDTQSSEGVDDDVRDRSTNASSEAPFVDPVELGSTYLQRTSTAAEAESGSEIEGRRTSVEEVVAATCNEDEGPEPVLLEGQSARVRDGKRQKLSVRRPTTSSGKEVVTAVTPSSLLS